MEQAETLLALYGAEERPETLQKVSVGPLSFLYTQSGLRRISWHGTELVRAIGWPIRDENWGTYPQEVVSEVINDDDEFDGKLTFSSGEGRLVCDLHIRANLNGELLADLTMTPKDGAFSLISPPFQMAPCSIPQYQHRQGVRSPRRVECGRTPPSHVRMTVY